MAVNLLKMNVDKTFTEIIGLGNKNIRNQEEKLNWRHHYSAVDSNGNIHAVFEEIEKLQYFGERRFCTLSSYYNNGDERTSFVGFYNGSYDMTIVDAIEVANERQKRGR